MALEHEVRFLNCNFAIPYFVSNTSMFDEFFKLIKYSQTPIKQNNENGSIFAAFIFMNGKRLFDMLSKTEDVKVFEQ